MTSPLSFRVMLSPLGASLGPHGCAACPVEMGPLPSAPLSEPTLPKIEETSGGRVRPGYASGDQRYVRGRDAAARPVALSDRAIVPVNTGRSRVEQKSKNALMRGTRRRSLCVSRYIGYLSSRIGPSTHSSSSSESASGIGSGPRQAPDFTARKTLGTFPHSARTCVRGAFDRSQRAALCSIIPSMKPTTQW